MTQPSGRPERRSASTLRAQHKEGMRRALLATAVDLIALEGPEALTVKRLADEFGSSVGMIYRLFDSKEALLTAIRAVRFTGLAESADQSSRSSRSLIERADGVIAVKQLAAVLEAGRFWVDAGRRSPGEVDALRHLLANPDVRVADRTAATDEVLQPLSHALDGARDAGGLNRGDGRARAATVVIVLAIALPTADLGGDPHPGPELGEQLVATLLSGWGAPSEALAAAAGLLRR